jgi:hypothetical protein
MTSSRGIPQVIVRVAGSSSTDPAASHYREKEKARKYSCKVPVTVGRPQAELECADKH